MAAPAAPPRRRRRTLKPAAADDMHRIDARRLRNHRWPEGWARHGNIGDAFDAYNAEHSHRRKEWKYYITEMLNQFLAVNAIDEAWPVECIDKERCKVYKAALLNGTIVGDRKRRPGPVTIARKLGSLHHFVKWLVNNDHLEHDCMAGLALPPKLVSNARVQKEGFSEAELEAIFNKLAQCRTHADPMRQEFYWVILLLAHSGARVMEVVQLLQHDVAFDEDAQCWFFNIVGNGHRRQVKNRASVRQVPIHSAVINAGFLDWWKSQVNKERLFPMLNPYGAQKASGWFTKALKTLKIKRPSVTLHSLRHTFTIKLERARVHYSLMRRLLGHTIGKAVEDRVYLGSLKYSVAELREAVEAVKLPSVA